MRGTLVSEHAHTEGQVLSGMQNRMRDGRKDLQRRRSCSQQRPLRGMQVPTRRGPMFVQDL
ncbi:hypothetical protein DPMN_077069 [Dreissena polymorpha]|uniref:Uncharacterized protein n=1 Tax=Dreissena polymorpha TaxID=45954 RepID=A0A9D3YN75_DREPO|nr:hypothetical protein DPMN_077069 [Dreissena polymorpha]